MKLKTQHLFVTGACAAGLILVAWSMGGRGALEAARTVQANAPGGRGQDTPSAPNGVSDASSEREAGDPSSMTPEVADAVRDLAQAIQDRDSAGAGKIAVEFFSVGPDALPALLELAATDGFSPKEVEALGALFRVGADRLVRQPERLAPWTIDTFTTASLDLLSAHPQIPSILYTAFCESGVHLDSSQLPALLDAFRSREVGPVAKSQFPCLELAKTWAIAMDATVEPLLLARTADPEQADTARADAAAMLLARDWRRAVPQLAIQLEESGQGVSKRFQHVACSHLVGLEPIDQAHYFDLMGSSPRLAVAMAEQMEPAAAALAIDLLPEGPDLDFKRSVLRLRTGSFAGMDEVFEVLEDRTRAESLPQLTSLAVRALVRSDAAFDKALSERLLDRFTGATEKASLFRALMSESRSMDEARLFAVVLPILDSTTGDANSGRQALARSITARYPELSFD